MEVILTKKIEKQQLDPVFKIAFSAVSVILHLRLNM